MREGGVGLLVAGRSVQHERAGVGRVLEHRRDGGCRRASPMQIAVAVAARQLETALVECAHHLCDCAHLQEGRKQQIEPFLHLHVRVFDDDTGGIADETDRQGKRKLTPLRLRKKTRRQPTADRMQFKLRYRAFETEQQPAIRAAGIIDAITVGDEAAV